jgi:membrane protein implicated in regulation of membrane protease activity
LQEGGRKVDWTSWLHGLYLFASVFSIGVVAIDMLGLLGSGEGDSHADADHDTGDHDAGDHAPLLSVLRYLRLGIYFSLGFGPLGLIAEATGAGGLGSLAWAVPGGIVAAWLARAFFRFQQHDVDSSIQEETLLLERGRVIVPLSSTNMGKVRVRLGQIVVERYALAEDAWETFRTNDVVEIVRISDDCVYVRRAEGSVSLDEPWESNAS